MQFMVWCSYSEKDVDVFTSDILRLPTSRRIHVGSSTVSAKIAAVMIKFAVTIQVPYKQFVLVLVR